MSAKLHTLNSTPALWKTGVWVAHLKWLLASCQAVARVFYWLLGCCWAVLSGCQCVAMELLGCSEWLSVCCYGVAGLFLMVVSVLLWRCWAVPSGCQCVAMELLCCSVWMQMCCYAVARLFWAIAIVLLGSCCSVLSYCQFVPIEC